METQDRTQAKPCLPQVANHLPEHLRAEPFAAIYAAPTGVRLPVCLVTLGDYIGYVVYAEGEPTFGVSLAAAERWTREGRLTRGPFAAGAEVAA